MKSVPAQRHTALSVPEGLPLPQRLDNVAAGNQRNSGSLRRLFISPAQTSVHFLLIIVISGKLVMGTVCLICPSLLQKKLCSGALLPQIPGHTAQKRLVSIGPSAVVACLLGDDKVPFFLLQRFPDGHLTFLRTAVELIQILRLIPGYVTPMPFQTAAPYVQINNLQLYTVPRRHLMQKMRGILRKAVADG